MFEFLKNVFHNKPVEDLGGGNKRPVLETVTHPSAPAPQPPVPSAPAPPAPQTFSNTNGNGNSVEISLQSVMNGFPPELKGRIRQSDVGDATVSIPLEKVMSQLSVGAVRITFGELRRAAPQLFSPGSDCDQVPVALPLNEILLQVNPASFARRQNQKQIEVPDEVRSPFGDRGNGLIFSVGPAKPETPAAPRSVPTATPPRSTTPAAPPRSVTPAAAPRSVAPAAAPRSVTPAAAPRSGTAAAAPPRPVTPAPALRSITPTAPVQSTPVQPKPAPPDPVPLAKPPIPQLEPLQSIPFRSPIGSTPTPLPPVAKPAGAPPASPAPPVFRGVGAAPAAAPRDPIPQSATPPAVEVPSLSVPLISLAEGWPEAVRQEIVQANLLDAKIALPVEPVEQALKLGKAAFPWKVLRSWIKPTPPPIVSVYDNAAVELPLKVIAPLFLNRRKDDARPHQKVAVDENIPNLFFGFPQAGTPSAAETAAPASHAVTKPVDTNYYVWDDASETARVDETELKRGSAPSPGTSFVTRCATPNEVVSRAAALEGVAGALIALPDGLMVANRLAPDLNGDTLAAFLPHIFGKVSQCTKELRMGELNNLNFTVGNVPWKIFRVNAIFFAVFGHPGQPLPTGQLVALAAELDRKKQ